MANNDKMYRLLALYSDGSTYEENDFDDLDDMELSLSAYANLFFHCTVLECNNCTIEGVKAYVNGEVYEQLGDTENL